jgi:hypothetical protein
MSLIQHGVRCNACGDRIFSNSRHDFVTCSCGDTFIDGGFDYTRVGFTTETGPPESIERLLQRPPKQRFRSR